MDKCQWRERLGLLEEEQECRGVLQYVCCELDRGSFEKGGLMVDLFLLASKTCIRILFKHLQPFKQLHFMSSFLLTESSFSYLGDICDIS